MSVLGRVSILMACRNGINFIDRSFNSILAQTWGDIELVFVDDDSSDNSVQYATAYQDKFCQKGYSLIIIQQSHQGFAAAAARGAQESTGQFMMLLDVDDYLMPESCRLQAEYLDSHPECDVVRTNGYVVPSDNLNSTTNLLVKSYEDKSKRNVFFDLITARTNNWAGAYMIRGDKYRDFYKDHRFYLSKYGQNLQFLLPLVKDTPAGFIDIPLFKYIRYAGSHSNQLEFEKQIENLNGYWDIRRKMLSLLGINNSTIERECEIAYHKRYIDITLLFDRVEDFNLQYQQLKELGYNSLDLLTKNAFINQKFSRHFYRIIAFATKLFNKKSSL